MHLSPLSVSWYLISDIFSEEFRILLHEELHFLNKLQLLRKVYPGIFTIIKRVNFTQKLQYELH